jgi:adenine deaminase
MDILETWINGRRVFEKGKTLFNYSGASPVNNFNCSFIDGKEIKAERLKNTMRVIDACDGELLTREVLMSAGKSGFVNPDPKADILKMIVKDRYTDKAPSVAFIRGFRLKSGAFASSIAHDSHNIICIGTNDKDIVNAVNRVVEMKGGLAVSNGNKINQLKLNIAGIMSDQSVREVAKQYEYLSGIVKSMGCEMLSPFMTLSFMALLVIPELKLSDRGLFDGKNFRFVSLFAE